MGDVGALRGDVSRAVQQVLAGNPDLVEHGEPVWGHGFWLNSGDGPRAHLPLLKPGQIKAEDRSEGEVTP